MPIYILSPLGLLTGSDSQLTLSNLTRSPSRKSIGKKILKTQVFKLSKSEIWTIQGDMKAFFKRLREGFCSSLESTKAAYIIYDCSHYRRQHKSWRSTDNYIESKNWRKGISTNVLVLWRVTLFKGQSHIPQSPNLSSAIRIVPGKGKQLYLLLFHTSRNWNSSWLVPTC